MDIEPKQAKEIEQDVARVNRKQTLWKLIYQEKGGPAFRALKEEESWIVLQSNKGNATVSY